MQYVCDWMFDNSSVCEELFETPEALLDHLAEHYQQAPPSEQQEVPC